MPFVCASVCASSCFLCLSSPVPGMLPIVASRRVMVLLLSAVPTVNDNDATHRSSATSCYVPLTTWPSRDAPTAPRCSRCAHYVCSGGLASSHLHTCFLCSYPSTLPLPQTHARRRRRRRTCLRADILTTEEDTQRQRERDAGKRRARYSDRAAPATRTRSLTHPPMRFLRAFTSHPVHPLLHGDAPN